LQTDVSPILDGVQFITSDAPIEDLKAAGSRVEFPVSLFPHQWNRERKIIITENDNALVSPRGAGAPKSKNSRLNAEIDALDEEIKRLRAQRLRLDRQQQRSTKRD
jgi:hypothetical protein